MAKIKDILRDWIQVNRTFVNRQQDLSRINKFTDIPFPELFDHIHQNYSPCFVLSTGRSGTKLLTKILNNIPGCSSVHEPYPELTWYSEFAYKNQLSHFETLTKMIDMARYEAIRDHFILGRTYIETSNRITFFAPQLANLYPKARFVHLVRNPLDFVTSGLVRNWYSGHKLHDEGRIIPKPDSNIQWDRYTQIEKIAWLWNETNSFIEDFSKDIQPERLLTIKSEDLFSNPKITEDILSHIGGFTLKHEKIRSIIKHPVNQKRSNIELTKEERKKVRDLTPLSRKYYG